MRLLPDPPTWSILQELEQDQSTRDMLAASMSQVLCTAIQIALVNTLAVVGIRFDAVVGHSAGEIAAGYAAGILSIGDAIAIAYYRGLVVHMASGPEGQKGAMMAINMTFDDATAFCSQSRFVGRLEVAASNAPSSATLSGHVDVVHEAKRLLDGNNVFAKLLRVDLAYHSRHMSRCVGDYGKYLSQAGVRPRKSPNACVWYSSVQPDIDLCEHFPENLSGNYWIENMAKPVLFSQALQCTLDQCGPFAVALEVGPHPVLKTPVSEVFGSLEQSIIPYIGCMKRGGNDVEAISNVIVVKKQKLCY